MAECIDKMTVKNVYRSNDYMHNEIGKMRVKIMAKNDRRKKLLSK